MMRMWQVPGCAGARVDGGGQRVMRAMTDEDDEGVGDEVVSTAGVCGR